MALSNAERQKRHRERLKAAARGAGLTDQQKADRDAVMAEAIYPDETSVVPPTFMGWNCHEWKDAPEELVEYFGMREAWEGWRRELDEMCVRAGMLPEYDRGELYREAKARSDRELEEYRERNRTKQQGMFK